MTAAQIGILAAIVVYLAAMVYVGFYFKIGRASCRERV